MYAKRNYKLALRIARRKGKNETARKSNLTRISEESSQWL